MVKYPYQDKIQGRKAFAPSVQRNKNMVLQYILLGILLIAALFIVIAVMFQKTKEDGLSPTIAGGTETYYGQGNVARTDKKLRKWTLIAGIVFVLAVLIVYIIQPDYEQVVAFDQWQKLSSYSEVFGN